MIGLIKKFFDRNDREVRKLWPRVKQINEIEAGLNSLSDDQLRQKTADWKAQLAKIEDQDELTAAPWKKFCRKLLRWSKTPAAA